MHDVLLVLRILLSVHRHAHVLAERAHVLTPNLEEITELDVRFSNEAREFEMQDLKIFVRVDGVVHGTEPDVLRDNHLLAADVDFELRVPVKPRARDGACRIARIAARQKDECAEHKHDNYYESDKE